jgi:hypothetical protein
MEGQTMHTTTPHTTYHRNRRRDAPPTPRWYVTCSCGADSRELHGLTFTNTGYVAGWIAEHVPELRDMQGILGSQLVPA